MPHADNTHPLVGQTKRSFAQHAEHPATDAGCFKIASEHPGERAQVAASILLAQHPDYEVKADPMTDEDRYHEIVNHAPSAICEVAEAILHTEHPEFKL